MPTELKIQRVSFNINTNKKTLMNDITKGFKSRLYICELQMFESDLNSFKWFELTVFSKKTDSAIKKQKSKLFFDIDGETIFTEGEINTKKIINK